MRQPLRIRALGLTPYEETWRGMCDFTITRGADQPDELWLVEHPPIYTRGRNAREVAPLGAIPTVDSDRGGDLTYHGPGQLVAYTLFDLGRLGIGVRQLVYGLEAATLATLTAFGISGDRRTKAPGIYVGGAKIASLGLRIKAQRSYHGLALNVDMDLEPFRRIAPCGYHGLQVTQMADHAGACTIDAVAPILVEAVSNQFHFFQGDPYGPLGGSTQASLSRP